MSYNITICDKFDRLMEGGEDSTNNMSVRAHKPPTIFFVLNFFLRWCAVRSCETGGTANNNRQHND